MTRTLLWVPAGLLLLGLSAQVGADEPPQEHSPWAPFPIVGYSPETSGLLGAGTVYTFRTAAPEAQPRRSSLLVVGWATLKRQYAIGLEPNIYLDGETWQFESQMGAALWPNTFYPLGPTTQEHDAENYSEQLLAGRWTITRLLFDHLRAGIRVAAVHAEVLESEPGGQIDTGGVTGAKGGTVVGVGPVVSRDSRDNNFESRSGSLYKALVGWHDASLGSEFDFVDAELDLRQFIPLWSSHHLALQAFARSTWGNPPFQLQAILGGKYNMRGYFEGRYRDRHLISAQAEYRAPLFWRLGGVAFVGAGQVAHSLDSIDLYSPKVAGGGGLRITINRHDRINLRFDAAANADGELNLYVHLGEAF